MAQTLASNQKMRYRMEQIARYRVNGRISDSKIADIVGLSASGLANLLKDPDYLEIEEAMYEGKLDDIDKQLAADDEALLALHREAVPHAMRAMIQTVVQNRDLRAKMAAAKEILDRDPEQRFVARSRAAGTNPGDPANVPQLPSALLNQFNNTANSTISQLKTQPNGGTRIVLDIPPTPLGGKTDA